MEMEAVSVIIEGLMVAAAVWILLMAEIGVRRIQRRWEKRRGHSA
jgi:hypothetical protein